MPRDLRKLEVGPQAISPSILVRKNSILVNLLHIRALVKADKVLVFDVMSGGDSHAQSIFMWDLEGKLRQGSKAMGGLPYELRYDPSVALFSDNLYMMRYLPYSRTLWRMLTLVLWRVF